VQPYRLASTHMTQGLSVSVYKTIMRPSHSHVCWFLVEGQRGKALRKNLDKRRVVYVLCM